MCGGQLLGCVCTVETFVANATTECDVTKKLACHRDFGPGDFGPGGPTI